MPRLFSLRWCLPAIRLAIMLTFIVVAADATMAAAEWESFKSAPVDANESVTIRGHISKPEGAGPFPAVIIAHGCFGVEENQFAWARRLNSWGYVTVIVDSFGPRDVQNVCTSPSQVSPETRAYDVYGAVTFLRRQAFVNSGKIGLIGFSHGGWTALCAAQKKFPARARVEPLQAVVAYYPWCPWLGLRETQTPLLVLMGKEDDWTPLRKCEKLLSNQKREYKNRVSLIAYDHAYHGFDDSSRKTPTEFDGHVLVFNSVAAERSINEAKVFFARYLE